MKKKFKTIAALGDKHLPYEKGEVAQQIIDIVAAVKPEAVVQLGDLYDFYWFSKYPKKMLNTTPNQEIELGRERAEEFWSAIRKASPRAKCWQLLGNHDDRPYKRVAEKQPEMQYFFGPTFQKLFEFPGVETIHDSSQELELEAVIGSILFHHGHRAKLGDHMTYNQQSTVNGHSHVGGVVFQQYEADLKFELNCGYSGDPTEGPLQYGTQKRRFWTWGMGLIDERGPRFIPLTVKGKK